MRPAAPASFDPARHDTASFACGDERLDTWLRAYASQNERRDAARTFVIADEADRVVGCYTFVWHRSWTTRTRRRRSAEGCRSAFRCRWFCSLVWRSADRSRGKGGIRAVLVDAFDDRAAAFYARFGSEPLPGDELTLMATVTFPQRALRRSG